MVQATARVSQGARRRRENKKKEGRGEGRMGMYRRKVYEVSYGKITAKVK
jgi:hypothetical protein